MFNFIHVKNLNPPIVLPRSLRLRTRYYHRCLHKPPKPSKTDRQFRQKNENATINKQFSESVHNPDTNNAHRILPNLHQRETDWK